MRIGVPREIKDGEALVGMTPEAVQALGAGSRVGYADASCVAAGARTDGSSPFFLRDEGGERILSPFR